MADILAWRQLPSRFIVLTTYMSMCTIAVCDLMYSLSYISAYSVCYQLEICTSTMRSLSYINNMHTACTYDVVKFLKKPDFLNKKTAMTFIQRICMMSQIFQSKI
jgi:hypothetical protein